MLDLLASLMIAGCWVPTNQSPGWRAFQIPTEAPALKAVGATEQLRGGERLVLVDRSPQVLANEWRETGRTRFALELASGATSATVRFQRPLRGARVEVLAHLEGRSLTVRDAREAGAQLSLSGWPSGSRWLEVVVHHHLRERPVVHEAVLERRAEAPVAGTRPGVLYVRHPGARRLELCDAPNIELRLPWPMDPPPKLDSLAIERVDNFGNTTD